MADRIASCLLRRFAPGRPAPSGGRSTRIARPVVDRYTRHGASAISSSGAGARVDREAVVATEARSSVSSVRRGVPKRSAVALEFVGDDAADAGRIGEDRLEFLDLPVQLIALGLELDAAEPGEPAQAKLEDVLGLNLAEVEDLDEPGARLLAVVGGADDLDDLVDVEDGQQEPLDQVQPFPAPREAELAASRDDGQPVVEVDLEQLLEAEGSGSALDERDVVDVEALLERGSAGRAARARRRN